MPRTHRVDLGDTLYHVINRANARIQIFDNDADYKTFEAVLTEAKERTDMRICAYCVMPNHWHLILYPKKDADMSTFMHWLTLTHTSRWHMAHGTTGTGHIYQGRYKSFPIQTDNYFLAACRYVERNALRARLVERAENWRWSSLWRREFGNKQQRQILAVWPVEQPKNYIAWVNQPMNDSDLQAIRRCVEKGCPYGTEIWTLKTAKQLGIESTLHQRGRPKKLKGVKRIE